MLANFFAAQSTITVRKATQLPYPSHTVLCKHTSLTALSYHYLHANNTNLLKATLSNLEIFRILISDDTLKPKLLAWWRAVPGKITRMKENTCNVVCSYKWCQCVESDVCAGGYSASVDAYEQSLSQYIASNPSGQEKFKTVYKLAQFFKGTFCKYNLLIINPATEIQDYKRAEAYMKRAINTAETIYGNYPTMADVLVSLVGILMNVSEALNLL